MAWCGNTYVAQHLHDDVILAQPPRRDDSASYSRYYSRPVESVCGVHAIFARRLSKSVADVEACSRLLAKLRVAVRVPGKTLCLLYLGHISGQHSVFSRVVSAAIMARKGCSIHLCTSNLHR